MAKSLAGHAFKGKRYAVTSSQVFQADCLYWHTVSAFPAY